MLVYGIKNKTINGTIIAVVINIRATKCKLFNKSENKKFIIIEVGNNAIQMQIICLSLGCIFINYFFKALRTAGATLSPNNSIDFIIKL